MGKRYAEGTTVAVESSQGEIAGILRKHGVTRQAWASEPTGDILQFELEGRVYRLSITRPTAAEMRTLDGDDYVYPDNVDWEAKARQEWKRRWRANVMLLKMKLEFADGSTTSIAREMMPYTLLKDGRTIEQAMLSDTNSLPLLEAKS